MERNLKAFDRVSMAILNSHGATELTIGLGTGRLETRLGWTRDIRIDTKRPGNEEEIEVVDSLAGGEQPLEG